MASKKSMVPIIAVLGIGAALLMGSGTAKASKSQSSSLPDDDLPPSDDEQEMPPPDNGGQQNPKDESWQTDADATPLTAKEKEMIDFMMDNGGIKVDSKYYPYPYNEKKANQSMLDWKTNLSFWSLFSTSQSPRVLEGKAAIPFKITQKMKDADHWAGVWLKIRNYIAYVYPDVEINEAYEKGLV